MFSKKATKIDEIFTVYLTVATHSQVSIKRAARLTTYIQLYVVKRAARLIET